MSWSQRETVVRSGWLSSTEFVPYVLDVLAVHGAVHRDPILFLSRKDFATLGEEWKFRK